MASVGSRVNVAVTFLVALVAGYLLWQFLTIYVNAFRFQDTVSSIAYRANEVPRLPEDLRQSVLGAATLLHLPVNKRGVQIFMITKTMPQIDVYYGQPMDLLLTTTYVRCHINNETVNIWFSSQQAEPVAKETPRAAPSRKRT